MDDLYYDPWDVEIDLDPYPTYRRLRDESPLYYNERHNFWGISRYADVDAGLKDTTRLSSAKGDILEVVLTDPMIPAGVLINEDPPVHTIHRAIVSRAFTPKKMRAIEDKVRAFCTACLDPLVGGERFDFVQDLGAELPMKTIGMLAGIPDSEQPAVRAHANAVLRNEAGKPMHVDKEHYFTGEMFGEYVEWREKHPSEDLITELLNVEFDDETGTTRKLTKQELVIFLAVVAGAGVETTGRLFGWMGKVLAEHPDQRKELAEDHSLIPTAIEELLRFEPPGPHVARYVAAEDVAFQEQMVPAGSAILLMLASANRDERHFEDPDRFDIRRKPGGHLTFGRGAHFCVGSPLARLEGRVALEEVLKRFPEWTIDMDNARRSRTSTVRGWDSMPAIVG
ncbi:cytochrome P450 [Mycobacterium intracellulare]|uniref:cytochrome P450 n=1 Tax=Mycobacterium intracellulare TaxID=1767 RepID=UPI001CD99921|nr:cytochrome P450 [Mycobacterium intracellulare]MCA2253086.1 cytochrome P450 [Mycobacterium intracellulare]MCA2303356.1 cytochrome P450 [Mycobacterium intracellulare]MCA2347015.1 cytochrome P450 [Mycobacterium intracellulare]UGU01468.1 cytochrome P450 [Mycobacterium intracellulare]